MNHSYITFIGFPNQDISNVSAPLSLVTPVKAHRV